MSIARYDCCEIENEKEKVNALRDRLMSVNKRIVLKEDKIYNKGKRTDRNEASGSDGVRPAIDQYPMYNF